MKITQQPKYFIKPTRRLTDKKGDYIPKNERKIADLKEKIATSQRPQAYTKQLRVELFDLKFKRYGV